MKTSSGPKKKSVTKPISKRALKNHAAIDVMKAWQMKCPLKLFRLANKVTLTTAALHIGVSVTSLQFWESGTRLPKYDHFKALASFMRKKCDGGKEANTTATEATWRKWLAAKPR